MPTPATVEDAAAMALDEALRDAGYAEAIHQPHAAGLEVAMLDALWNDDATLQQAAKAAVGVMEARLERMEGCA